MDTAYRFQTPHVEPLEQESEQVHFEVTATDAKRILRALDETSWQLAVTPSGSRLASSYRRLACDLRSQTRCRM
jgi:hypothetical protein